MLTGDRLVAYLNAEKMNWDMPLYLNVEFHPNFVWDTDVAGKITPVIEVRLVSNDHRIDMIWLHDRTFISTYPRDQQGIDEREACRIAREAVTVLYNEFYAHAIPALRVVISKFRGETP